MVNLPLTRGATPAACGGGPGSTSVAPVIRGSSQDLISGRDATRYSERAKTGRQDPTSYRPRMPGQPLPEAGHAVLASPQVGLDVLVR